MADINFSLDEYIARKSITGPSTGSRGGSARGAPRGGGGAIRGGRPLTARLGSRPPPIGSRPPPVKETVKPLMKVGIDARDKILEKVRKGDARDKIILKNRTKYRDAREKIGKPQQNHEVQHPPASASNGQRNGSARSAEMHQHQHLPAPPRAPIMPPTLESEQPVVDEDFPPRKRADARIIGRDNNIIVMAKNDFANVDSDIDHYKPQQPLRHGNPVVMIKNDRVRAVDDEPPPRYRAPAPPTSSTKGKLLSPRRGEAMLARRQPPSGGAVSPRRQPMDERLGSHSRSRSPFNNSRLAPRQPQPHYDSASDEEVAQPTVPEPKRKPIATSKRTAPPSREAPRAEKQARRGSPEPPRNSARNSTQQNPIAKKSTSILHGIKPIATSQIPKETPSEPGDKQSPIQGFRVLVSNLHSIVTQEDVVELFSACGALKRTKMIKPGVAEVVFVKREDAEMAVKKYNNRELDGQPMQCKMVTTPSSKPLSKPNEEPLLGGRLKPAKQAGEGSVEASTIHKALFNSAAVAAAEKSSKPVVFTVKI